MNRTSRERADAFLLEIIDVCKKHGLSISHEDSQGGFIIEPYSEYDVEWIRQADITPMLIEGNTESENWPQSRLTELVKQVYGSNAGVSVSPSKDKGLWDVFVKDVPTDRIYHKYTSWFARNSQEALNHAALDISDKLKGKLERGR